MLLRVSQFRASDDARCYFGQAWTNATVEDETTLSCTVPMSGKPKKVQVSASYNGGRDRSDNGPLFSYRESLSIDKVEPALLSEAGGTALKLFGRGFQQGDTAACDVDGIHVSAIVQSDRMVTCRAPPHAPGNKNVSLVTSYGRSSSVNVTYHATIEVESVAPQQCPSTGGCAIAMRGAFFPASWLCRFGGQTAPASVVRDTELRCKAPPHAVATLTVEVSANGADFVEVSDFEFVAPLTASVIKPRAGPPGTRILLTGFASTEILLHSELKCRFGGQETHATAARNLLASHTHTLGRVSQGSFAPAIDRLTCMEAASALQRIRQFKRVH